MFLCRNPLTEWKGSAKLCNPRLEQLPFSSTETVIHMCRKKTNKSHIIIVQRIQTRIKATLFPTLLNNFACKASPTLSRSVNKTIHRTLKLHNVLRTNIQSMKKLRRRCAKNLSLNFVFITLKKSRLNIALEKGPLRCSCQSEDDHAGAQRQGRSVSRQLCQIRICVPQNNQTCFRLLLLISRLLWRIFPGEHPTHLHNSRRRNSSLQYRNYRISGQPGIQFFFFGKPEKLLLSFSTFPNVYLN